MEQKSSEGRQINSLFFDTKILQKSGLTIWGMEAECVSFAHFRPLALREHARSRA